MNELATLCMGCMEPTSPAPVCLRCGYQENQPLASALHLRPRTELHGQYLVGRVLGHGGFGVTYLGWDLNLARKVAIKEYMPHGVALRMNLNSDVVPVSTAVSEDFQWGLQRYLDEGRLLARFSDHPSIVSVMNFFRANGTAYLVMEFLDGGTFGKFVDAYGGRISVEMSIQVMTPVMVALEAVHSQGILHRDISPDNIYITRNGSVKVLDFGAARQALGEKSRNLSVILKEGYAPVEQYYSKGNQGPWTDVYAVAATMYKAITGKIPSSSLDRHQHDDLAPPAVLGIAIQPHQQAALGKALALRTEDRFQSMAEFRAALSAQPISQQPISQQPVISQPMQPISGDPNRQKTVYESPKHKVPVDATVMSPGAGQQAPGPGVYRQATVIQGPPPQGMPPHGMPPYGNVPPPGVPPHAMTPPPPQKSSGFPGWLIAIVLVFILMAAGGGVAYKVWDEDQKRQAEVERAEAERKDREAAEAAERERQVQEERDRLEREKQAEIERIRREQAESATMAETDRIAREEAARSAQLRREQEFAQREAEIRQREEELRKQQELRRQETARREEVVRRDEPVRREDPPVRREPPRVDPAAYDRLIATADNFGKNRQTDRALTTLQQAVQLNPERWEAYSYLGYYYTHQKGDLHAARRYYREAIAHNGFAYIHVYHDHENGTFRQNCAGNLAISSGKLLYYDFQKQHSFDAPWSQVREVKKNLFVAQIPGTFHVKLASGANFNFVANSINATNLDITNMILELTSQR